MNRRDFLRRSTLAFPLAAAGCAGTFIQSGGIVLNDVHSMLNATRVRDVTRPDTLEKLIDAVIKARRQKACVSISGGRHAMGAQQFGTDSLHVDIRGLNRILSLDAERGIMEMEGGIQWPKLVEDYLRLQQGSSRQWGFNQKQTGADALGVGGAISANAHGRGLTLKPVAGSVISMKVVSPSGELLDVSREKNPDLFRLICGGYGLFGPIYSATLQMTQRRKMKRVVELIDAGEIPAAVKQRILDGYLYGDFQFAIDPGSEDFLRKGVFACYAPVPDDTPIPDTQRELTNTDWIELLRLAHTDKAKAFDKYSRYYLSTNGQIYWSDTHQMSFYPEGYHLDLDRVLGRQTPGSEMITEIYVQRDDLPELLEAVAKHLRGSSSELIYGTCRFIEKDTDSFMPWARESYACTVMNLHVDHSPSGMEKAKAAFRGLIDIARRRGGSYFLTYHKWATREQVLDCYPQFPDFLRLKKEYDPEERFQSDWYRHHVNLLG